MAREAPRCRPGTAGTVRRRRSEGTAWGRCPPPAAGGSVGRRRAATAGPPRGPCSPSAAARRPESVLENEKIKKMHEDRYHLFAYLLSVYRRSQAEKMQAAHTLVGDQKDKKLFGFHFTREQM